MSISRLNGSEPIRSGETEQPVEQKEDDKKTSIFDTDKNGEISVEEMKDAISKDETISNAVAKGFKLDTVFNIIEQKCSNLPIFNNESYQSLPEKVIEMADKYVQGLIKMVKEDAVEFLNSSQKETKVELNPPKNMGEGWGLEDEHMDYIFDKLEQLGVPASQVDMDTLIDIMSRYDYALDKNSDAKITPKEANKMHDGGWSAQFLNKDENGKAIDTHVLDWIINRYLEKVKQTEE